MGTHPIFESDFDCLTDNSHSTTTPDNCQHAASGINCVFFQAQKREDGQDCAADSDNDFTSGKKAACSAGGQGEPVERVENEEKATGNRRKRLGRRFTAGDKTPII